MTTESFNATIEYGKLAITLVSSLGASVGLACPRRSKSGSVFGRRQQLSARKAKERSRQ